jgi:hypothetical protein
MLFKNIEEEKEFEGDNMNMFNNSHSYNFDDFEEQDNYDEQYLIGIWEVANSKAFYVLAPSRKALGELLLNLPTDRYMMVGLQLLSDMQEYNEVLKKLKDQIKSDDLNFGNNDNK